MSDLLKNSLYSAYRDSPAILDMFDQVDFSKLTYQFTAEMNARITPEERDIVENMLASELVKRYDSAVLAATLACTRSLSDLLELVLLENTGKTN